MKNPAPTRRNFIAAAGVVLIGGQGPPGLRGATTQREVIDFSRSFCYYVPASTPIWVRIQSECHCRVHKPGSQGGDEYVLGVRTQTGLRTNPPSDRLDPGYDFWMVFSKKHVYVKRVHTSSYSNNPTRVPVSEFVQTGWHLPRARARQLVAAAEIRSALQAWQPMVARTRFSSSSGGDEYTIEYPVKWADANLEEPAFRVETGPILLLDPNRIRAGAVPEFDDLRWAYLDYHSFQEVRFFVERPTPILSGATYDSAPSTPRRNPALTDEQVRQIEERLYSAPQPPLPPDQLRRLFQTDHYSAVEFQPVKTELYALE